MFLGELGLKEPGLEKLVAVNYELLGLISYLISGKDGTRAWIIEVGTRASQAVGKIHIDFEYGFTRTEVVNYQDLPDRKIYPAAKEKGSIHLEGKDYVARDDDVILFRFNV